MRDFKSIDSYLMDIYGILCNGEVTKDDEGKEFVVLDIDRKTRNDICDILDFIYNFRL